MNAHYVDAFRDKPEEECGVFGIFARGEDVAKLTYYALYALQHRGQESAGIAVADGDSVFVVKDLGLVSQVFDEANLASLPGHIAIGHTRYSTTGSNHWENAQPIHKSFDSITFAVAHNGNLVNSRQLHDEMDAQGAVFSSTSDTEIVAEMISRSTAPTIEEAIAEVAPKLEGAFSMVFLTEDKLIALRDAHGFRPLTLGQIGDNYVLASETCGLDIIGAKAIRDIEPGEMVVVDDDGLRSTQAIPSHRRAFCIFEHIYFSRPDSILEGKTLYNVRKMMGMKLAEEAPADADIVIPIPDSGTSAAIGYAERSGIPFGEGMIKNRYIGRTFIQPSQSIRKMGVRIKLNPLREVIEGKRLVVVDDSIVRGNTSKKIIKILRDAGAREIHMRISSPPIMWPCFYGIDTPSDIELIASTKTVEEIAEFINVDSLAYLSLESVVAAAGGDYEDYCCACFDGHYPTVLPDKDSQKKNVLETERSGD